MSAVAVLVFTFLVVVPAFVLVALLVEWLATRR